MDDAQALFEHWLDVGLVYWRVYWPAAAMAGALFAVLLSLMWVVTCVPRIRSALVAISANSKDLKAAREQAQSSLDGMKARRGEIEAMHKDAGALFWRVEKTWVG